MESAFKKGPLRSGSINKAKEYGPYVLWKITLFWEMGMSQETAGCILCRGALPSCCSIVDESGETRGPRYYKYVLKASSLKVSNEKRQKREQVISNPTF